MKKIFILIAILICIKINAQPPNNIIKDNIPINFNIYLNGIKQETDSVLIATGASKSFIKVPDNFTTFLAPNREYTFTITHPKYNKKIVKVVPTIKDKNITCDIYLHIDKPDEYLGILKYNQYLKKYVAYK